MSTPALSTEPLCVDDTVRVTKGLVAGRVGRITKVHRQKKGEQKVIFWVQFGDENHAFFRDELERTTHRVGGDGGDNA